MGSQLFVPFGVRQPKKFWLRRIGMAMGILMSAYKLSETEAFDLLVVVSQHHNRKLRDIADDVVFTGSLDWVLNESA